MLLRFRFSNSLKRIMSKYQLEPSHKYSPNLIKQNEQHQGQPQSASIDNEQKLKEKFLLSKVQPYEDETSDFYALYTRPQNLFFRKKIWLKRPLYEDQQKLEKDIKEGEEGVDKVKVPELWNLEVQFEQFKAEKSITKLIYENNTIKSENYKAYSVQQFRKYNKLMSFMDTELGPYKIKKYPGNPKQNPEAFRKWFIENHPPELIKKLHKVQKFLKFRTSARRSFKARQQRKLNLGNKRVKSDGKILSNDQGALSQMDTVEHLSQNAYDELRTNGSLTFRSFLDQHELEPLPPKLPMDDFEIVMTVDRWSILRMIPQLQKQFKENKTEEENEKDKQEESARQEVVGESLMPYYQTLPEFMRNDPNVKMVFRGLEFHAPGLPLFEKQKSLNFACKYSLPMNEFNTDMMTRIFENKRPYPSKYDINRLIHNQDPKNIIDAYVNPKAVKQYMLDRTLQTNLNGKNDLPKPSLDLEQEQQDDLPVDFYDNEDGFWDSYIKKKEERYTRSSKLYNSRPFFKH